MARRWWNFISLLTEKPYQTMFDSLQGWLAWYPLCEIWLWLQNSLNLFPVQMEGSSHPKHSTFQLKFCIFLGCELQGDKVLTHNYCKIMIIYIYIWLRARFRRYFLRGFLHVVICTQKSCESDSVSVCCTSKHCGWRHLKHRRGCLASLHMVAELGRGAWSRSLVAEQLVGGAEAVKREIQRERGRERERKKPHSAEARC